MENKRLKPIAQIIMTPIIDVVMIMLLFFMIAYARSSPSFFAQRVEVPKSTTAEEVKQDKTSLEISISREGEIIVEKQKLNLNELDSHLRFNKNRGIEKVIIRGDQAAPYAKIIEVIDKVKENQISKVLLLTKKGEPAHGGK